MVPNLPKGDNGSPAEFPEPCSPVPCLAAGTKPGALPPPAPSSASSDCPELPNLSDMPELPEWDTGASQSLETPCDFPDLPTLGEGDNSSPSLEIDDHSSAHDCHGSDTDELTLAVARGTDLPTSPASGCGFGDLPNGLRSVSWQ